MIQRKRRQGNTINGPEIVGWAQPTGGKAGSDGGLHPPYEEAVTLEHHRGVLPELEPTRKSDCRPFLNPDRRARSPFRRLTAEPEPAGRWQS